MIIFLPNLVTMQTTTMTGRYTITQNTGPEQLIIATFLLITYITGLYCRCLHNHRMTEDSMVGPGSDTIIVLKLNLGLILSQLLGSIPYELIHK